MPTNALAPMPVNALDRRVQEQFGMQPNMDRLNVLPRYSAKEGWVAPNMLYQAARGLAAPSASMEMELGPEEAMNVAGFGLRGAPKLTGPDLKGLVQAVKNNTFTYGGAGNASLGFGRHIGYPQSKGTPAEKLFSNFADTKTDAIPHVAETFRTKMLERANKSPTLFAKDTTHTTEMPFAPGFIAKIDAAKSGNTRVQILQDGNLAAAARLNKGMLDSIAVDKDFKGQNIGVALADFLDKNNLGNVFEVPDRSPGMVEIQRKLLSRPK